VEQGAGAGGAGSTQRFELHAAPTAARNAYRLLRAMQLRKAILLEGSPGVGKTSLVAALAKQARAPLVRINLSEHTDIMDLLGADLPAPGGAAGQFAWCDGPLLGALKRGAWVLLDELNLANQVRLSALAHRMQLGVPHAAAGLAEGLHAKVSSPNSITTRRTNSNHHHRHHTQPTVHPGGPQRAARPPRPGVCPRAGGDL